MIRTWCTPRYPLIQPGWEMKSESMRIEACAHAMVHSKLLFPETLKLDECVVDAAIRCVPQEVRSVKGDTNESLCERIVASGFFDDLQALRGGGRGGPARVNLNATTHATPRRKSWSIVLEDVHIHQGVQVRTMYAYGKKNSRIRTVVHADPMPRPVFDLGFQCFCSARHMLSAASATAPPNHCQLVAYYQLFQSKIGVHRDNYTMKDFQLAMFRTFKFDPFIAGKQQIVPGLQDTMRKGKGRVEAFCPTPSKCAQFDGSDVLVFSVGHAKAHFRFHFPSDVDKDQLNIFRETELLDVHPDFTVELSNGTLFVFKAIDDLLFQHDVVLCSDGPADADRLAFCFRWMGVEQQQKFSVQTGEAVDMATSEPDGTYECTATDTIIEGLRAKKQRIMDEGPSIEDISRALLRTPSPIPEGLEDGEFFTVLDSNYNIQYHGFSSTD